MRMRKARQGDDDAKSDLIEQDRAAIRSICEGIKARGGVIFAMHCRFDIYSWVAGPHGKFQKPSITLFINYAIYGHISCITASLEFSPKGFEDLARELRTAGESDDRSH